MTLSTLNRMSIKDYKKQNKVGRTGLIRIAQSIFNRFIRRRDEGRGCISCGSPHANQAGHYQSVGSHPELRFNEDNVHLQCGGCNHFKSGNLIKYRAELVKKIGEERVKVLEGPNDPKKYSTADLRLMIEAYKARTREIESSYIVGIMSEVG